MSSVDERVVEMRFNNKDFEANARTSISTLEKLKQSLNFSGASSGLKEVSSAVDNVNMSGLGNAVETVRAKFSALQVMGVTALADITRSAVNAGKKMVSALTIDPIKSGFSEYETKMGAIQTIMSNTASKGTTMQDVTRVIGELNTYADKTIYNFAEMTRNIGTFTAAGVGLEESASAIQGIANLAAASGSSSQQASTAMYQLSQALAAGTVKLMDWNSVVNAGMGGQIFQDALKATARDHGIAVDEMIEKNGSFRESLQEGWISADILNETLNKFTVDGAKAYGKSMVDAGKWTQEQADALVKTAQDMEDAATKVKTFTQLWDTLKESAQSGWGQTWEILVGDFEEAKETLTEISDVIGGMIGASADSRNDLLNGALSTGWKQLLSEGIEDAAGFEEMVSNVAKEHGVKLEEMIDDEHTFQDTLKEGWLTGDMLSESVEKFTDKLSNMSEEELEAAGYTQETVDKMKALNEQVKKSEISMDEFAKKMARPSGRELIIESLWNAFNGLLSVIEPVKQAFRDIFPAMESEQLYGMIQAVFEFSKTLKLSETAADNLKRTFAGVFAVFDIVGEAISAVVKAIVPLFGEVSNLGGGILGVTAAIGDWLVGLRNSVKESNIFSSVCQGIVSVIQSVISILKSVGGAVNEAFVTPALELFGALISKIGERMSSVGDAAKNMGSTATKAIDSMAKSLAGCGFIEVMQTIWNSVSTFGKNVANAIGSLFEKLTNTISNANFSGVFDFINSVSLAGIAAFVAKFIKGFSDITDSISSFKESAIGILDEVRGCFEAYQNQLKAETLKKIAVAIAILAASLLVISLIDSEKLSSAIAGITMLFGELMGSMAIFSKISGTITGALKSVTAMIGIATAVLILAGALKTIGDMKLAEIGKGLVGVIGLTATLPAAMSYLSKHAQGGVKGATQMVIFAAAVKVLASVCADLATLKWEELAKGLVGVGALLAEISLFMNNTKFSGKSITTATGIVILAAALKIIASVCNDFASMTWDEIGRGLAMLAATLAAVTAAVNYMPNNMISIGTGLIAVSAALVIMASALNTMSGMSWDEIGRGLAVLAASLAAVTAAVNFMPDNMISIGTGLIAVSAALVIMASALGSMGGMSWDEIGKSLVTLAGSLLVLSVALNTMTGTLGGAAALLVASTSLIVLGGALSILGGMSWGEIAKSLVTLAGAITVIGVAGALLSPIIPAIIGLGAAFALIGVGVAAVGAGLLAAGAGIAAISAAIAGGATAIVAALTSIIVGIAGTIPTIIAKLGEGLVALCEVIATGAPAIAEAAKAIVLSLVDVFVECVPTLAEGALQMLTGLLSALTEHMPQIGDMLFQLVVGAINDFASRVPELVDSLVNLFTSLFSSVFNAIGSIDTETLLATVGGIGILTGLLVALSAVAGLIPGAMAGVLGLGLVAAEIAIVIAAIGALAQLPGLEWFINEGGALLQGIGSAIGQFIGGLVGGVAAGITSHLPQIGSDLSAFMLNVTPFIMGAKLVDDSVLTGVGVLAGAILAITAADLISSAASFLSGGSSFADLGSELSAFMTSVQPFIDGAKLIDASVVDSVNSLAQVILTLTGANLLDSLTSWLTGGSSLADFGAELAAFGPSMKAYADSVAGIDNEAIVASSTAAKNLADMAAALPNEGGLAGFFAGENNMETFGSQLASFGSALKEYASAVVGIDLNAIDTSVLATKSLAGMADALPNDGGVAGFFAGDNDLETFGSNLKSFGEDLVGYSNTVSGIESTTVIDNATNIVTSITSLGTNIESFNPSDIEKVIDSIESLFDLFENVDDFSADGVLSFNDALNELAKNGVTNFINAFNGASSQAIKAGAGLITNVVNGVKGKNAALTTASKNVVDALIKNINDGGTTSKFNSAGQKLATAVGDGIKNKQAAVVSAVKSLIDTVVSTLNNQHAKFQSAAKNLASGLAKGFTASTGMVKNVIKTFMNSILQEIENSTKNFKAAGEALATAVGKGFGSGKTSVAQAAKTLANSAINSIEDKREGFVTAGQYVAEGMADGIIQRKSKVVESAINIATAAIDAAKETLGIQSPSKVFREEVGRMIGEGFILGLADETKNVKYGTEQLTLDMVKSLKDCETPIIDTATELTDEMLNALKGSSYLEWLFDVSGGTPDDMERSTFHNTYDRYVKWLKEQQELNQLTLDEELYAWELAASILDKAYKAGFTEFADRLKEANENVAAVREEINKTAEEQFQHSRDWINKEKQYERLSLNEEYAAWKRVQGRYSEGTEQRIEADKEVYRLEKEIADLNEKYYKDVQALHEESTARKIELEEEYKDKFDEINKQLIDDIKSVNDAYDDAVKSRTETLRDAYGLFDEVGEKEAVDNQTLMMRLQGQVSAFDDWSADMLELSLKDLPSDLLEELRAMGPSAAAEIKALNNMSLYELEFYKDLWNQKNKQSEEQAKYELKELRAKSDEEIRQLELNAEAERQAVAEQWAADLEALNSEVTEKLKALKDEWLDALGIIDKDDKSALTLMMEEVTKIIGEHTNWSELGGSMIDGLIAGIVNNATLLNASVEQVMASALNYAKQTWDINSPSKEFAKIGMYGDKGLAYGLLKFSGVVLSAVKSVGTEAINGMSDSISGIVDIINSDVDTSPTIRPVIDLTDVRNGAKQISSMFSGQKALSIDSSSIKASAVARDMDRPNDNVNQNGVQSTSGNSYQFVQNNYSPKALSRSEIYRQTNNQFSAMKRMVKA